MWLKAFHLVFMVTWFAGLFYLPRLFVYHADATDSISNERFKIMERKLYAIMSIGMLLTLIFGIAILVYYAWAEYSHSGWLHAKLLLVVLLVIFHIYCGKIASDFRQDRNRRSHKFYRWLNEVPALALVAITVLAVLKPF